MSPRRHDYSEVVSYEQAHLRLKTDLGRPTQYNCIECGGQAKEWSYMGGCPDELLDRKGRPYSLDQSRYEPMCVSCHRRRDIALREGRTVDVCSRGHEWNAENTGIRVKRGPSSGIRYCRACNREAIRDRRARLRGALMEVAS